MAEEFDTPDLRSAHVIVLGNEKGGTGKSTLSIHITIALLKAGYRVASIDLDVRRPTLTRFLENRRSWAQTAPWPVELLLYYALDRGASDNVRDNDRGGGAFLRIRRDRYAGQRLLPYAARAFPCRYFGLAGERELHRCRCFLARASRPHKTRPCRALR